MPSFEIVKQKLQKTETVIKVVGVGGCGGNAVNNMIDRKIYGVEFITCNTDSQALKSSNASVKLQFDTGKKKGLGAGHDPITGRNAANACREKITDLLRDSDLVFVTAGLGKGTGSGAGPVVADIAKKLGCLTVGVVTMPFDFEGPGIKKIADESLRCFFEVVDTLIIVRNQKLLEVYPHDTPMRELYAKGNDLLYHAVKGIAEIITVPAYVNVDFADVKNVLTSSGISMMGLSTASGEGKGRRVVEEAMSHKMQDFKSLKKASAVLLNIKGNIQSKDLTDMTEYVRDQISESAKLLYGFVEDENEKQEISVTVIVTGFPKEEVESEICRHTELTEQRSDLKQKKTTHDYTQNLQARTSEENQKDKIEHEKIASKVDEKREISNKTKTSSVFELKLKDNELRSPDRKKAERIDKKKPETPAYLRRIGE